MQIEFIGAVDNEVTGSGSIITARDGNQILVDFGMFQGSEQLIKKNYDLLAFHPPALQAVFLTHAHLDHCGRLPLLVYGGYFGKIYMTEPTKALINIILNDSAKIAEQDIKKEPLYTSDEVRKLLDMVEVVRYDQEISVGSFKAIYRNAGHILGSSSIEIIDISAETQTKIVFSGDLGNTPQNIEKPTRYVDSADVVIMESTYGDSLHPVENPEEIIREEINTIEEKGGVLLIPAFALERTQEILHIIHHLKKEGKVSPETPVYFDSPMGIDETGVYMEYLDYFNDEIRNHKDIPFNFDGLILTYDSRDCKNIIGEPNPKVIIAGSGMLSGGRIMQHAANYLSQKDTRLLYVGYQAEETLGRDILEGLRNIIINDKQLSMNASIKEIKTLSAHADQSKLLSWLSHIKGVKTVFLNHGEENQRKVLAEKIKTDLGIKNVILPGYQQYNLLD